MSNPATDLLFLYSYPRFSHQLATLAAGRQVPPTRTLTTPTGGVALVFKRPPGLIFDEDRKNIAQGLDVYTSLPPILKNAKQDERCPAEPAELPDWLLKLIDPTWQGNGQATNAGAKTDAAPAQNVQSGPAEPIESPNAEDVHEPEPAGHAETEQEELPAPPEPPADGACLAAALEYLRRGFSVVPIRPKGKLPLVPWKEFQDRRASEDEVRSWFAKWPRAGVAIVTGAISRLVVLDIDGPEGEESVKGKELPVTLIARTGRGHHHYFRYPEGQVKTRPGILHKVDVKADGGYVLAPPSQHPSGALYEWALQEPPSDMPPWLLDIAREKTGDKKAPSGAVELSDSDIGPADWFEAALKGVGQGERNKTATRLLGRWLGLGMTAGECWPMLQDWNRKNTPPMPEDELRVVFDSIYHAEARKRQVAEIESGTVNPKTIEGDPEKARDAVSEALGVKVEGITRYLSDPPRYQVCINGIPFICHGKDLIKAQYFCELVYVYCKVLINQPKPAAWRNIARLFTAFMQDQRVGDESGRLGVFRGNVLDYLDQWKAIEEGDRIEGDYPFVIGENVHIRCGPFRKALKLSLSSCYSDEDLGAYMSALGFESKKVRLPAERVIATQRNQTPRVWIIPLQKLSSLRGEKLLPKEHLTSKDEA